MSKRTKGILKFDDFTSTIRSLPANHWIATVDSWDGMVSNKANGDHLVACWPVWAKESDVMYAIIALLVAICFGGYLTTVPKQKRKRGWDRLEQDMFGG